jgi:acid phosphatase class B
MKKLIIMLSAITLIACKNSAKTTKVDNSTTQETTNPNDMVFDVIVKFISKGEGIANNLKTQLEEAVAKFNKDNHTNIEADVRHWGREGETDLNYNLKNLSTKQKNAFISLVKETVGHTDMAHIKYNEKGVQKR